MIKQTKKVIILNIQKSLKQFKYSEVIQSTYAKEQVSKLPLTSSMCLLFLCCACVQYKTVLPSKGLKVPLATLDIRIVA